ncbi:hypothetical protein Aab01nite_72990 [Paractinoplanes abujensis]|nr:hypothetical protein Aab01nite_72990 [Actinoplanes abujensis]
MIAGRGVERPLLGAVRGRCHVLQQMVRARRDQLDLLPGGAVGAAPLLQQHTVRTARAGDIDALAALGDGQVAGTAGDARGRRLPATTFPVTGDGTGASMKAD